MWVRFESSMHITLVYFAPSLERKKSFVLLKAIVVSCFPHGSHLLLVTNVVVEVFIYVPVTNHGYEKHISYSCCLVGSL
jgi:hypothetical protein